MKVKSIACPLETFIPTRAVGQRDVLSLTLPPMPPLAGGFCGCWRSWTDGSYTLVSYPWGSDSCCL